MLTLFFYFVIVFLPEGNKSKRGDDMTRQGFVVIERSGIFALTCGHKNGEKYYTVDAGSTTGFYEGYNSVEASDYYHNAVKIGDINKL